MGGEKFLSALPCNPECGSPPRGRGKVLEFALVFRWCRITPAWAGKSGSAGAVGFCSWDHPRVGGEKPFSRAPPPGDHPRVGGEKLISVKGESRPVGSPPRGRGKDMDEVADCTHVRITPAWAGKSRVSPNVTPAAWDHPRVGGEKTQNPIGGQFQQGSPPRGRGKDLQRLQAHAGRGITPAWAGKSQAEYGATANG